MHPRYSYPVSILSGLAANILFGGQRSFRQDGLACTGRLDPPLQVLGRENIPQTGPCLITFNHYYRPGFSAWWMALALAAVIPEEIHFVMTGELTYPGKWYASIGMAGSRWLLSRISKVYSFTTMPPMPPRPKDFQARAESVRKVLAFAETHPQAFIGLAPEGGDQPGGMLTMPQNGTGRFIALIAEAGYPILPVGVYEENGCFCLHFGKMYSLETPPNISASVKDHFAAEITMKAIAPLLPERLQGDFRHMDMAAEKLTIK